MSKRAAQEAALEQQAATMPQVLYGGGATEGAGLHSCGQYEGAAGVATDTPRAQHHPQRPHDTYGDRALGVARQHFPATPVLPNRVRKSRVCEQKLNKN